MARTDREKTSKSKTRRSVQKRLNLIHARGLRLITSESKSEFRRKTFKYNQADGARWEPEHKAALFARRESFGKNSTATYICFVNHIRLSPLRY